MDSESVNLDVVLVQIHDDFEHRFHRWCFAVVGEPGSFELLDPQVVVVPAAEAALESITTATKATATKALTPESITTDVEGRVDAHAEDRAATTTRATTYDKGRLQLRHFEPHMHE